MKIDTMDSFVSLVISEVFDFVMRTRRDYLKNLTSSQISRFCETLLKTLKDQE